MLRSVLNDCEVSLHNKEVSGILQTFLLNLKLLRNFQSCGGLVVPNLERAGHCCHKPGYQYQIWCFAFPLPLTSKHTHFYRWSMFSFPFKNTFISYLWGQARCRLLENTAKGKFAFHQDLRLIILTLTISFWRERKYETELRIFAYWQV